MQCLFCAFFAPCAKKSMRKLFFTALTVILFQSCQPPLFSDTLRIERSSERYRHHRPPEDSVQADDPGPHVYLSGIRFPEWAAWRDGDYRGARIVLWKDGKEAVSVPAGNYVESGRHRIMGGKLWTDDTDGASTVISCNGEPRFSFPGEELIVGLLEKDGRVHSLGQRPGRGGIVYRVDGEERFSAPEATALGGFDQPYWKGGALMEDGGKIHYAYALPLKYSDAYRQEYIVMQEDRMLRRIPDSAAEQIFDIRVWGGSIWRAEQHTPRGPCILIQDDSAFPLPYQSGESLHQCRLLPYGNGLCVKGYSYKNEYWRSWVASSDGTLWQEGNLCKIIVIYPRDALGTCISADDTGTVRALSTVHGMVPNWTIGMSAFRLDSEACMAIDADGTLHTALTGVPQDYPYSTPLAGGLFPGDNALLEGDNLVPFPFNGWFCSIRIE